MAENGAAKGTEEEWGTVLAINLKSAFLCAKQAIPSMLARGKGVVINLASDKASFITGQYVRIDGGLGLSIAGSKRD